MMKIIIYVFILSSFHSCSSSEIKNQPYYEVINEVWNKQGTIEDLEKQLGKPDILNTEKAEYLFPGSKIPQMHFGLKKNGRLESVLLFLEEGKIEKFKSYLNCHWLESKGQKQISDAIYLTHEGYCKDAQIRFNYFSSLHSYEIWWGPKLKDSK
jgi:hypothetical protein